MIAFLFQWRAIANFPFLLSLLSLMLICQHFFLWSLIVCPASIMLPLFWQLLRTLLLLCPSHTCFCVIFVTAFDVWNDLTEFSAWRNLPFQWPRRHWRCKLRRGVIWNQEHMGLLWPNKFASRFYPFSPLYGTTCNFLCLQSKPCTLHMLLWWQKWPGTKMEWGLSILLVYTASGFLFSRNLEKPCF